MIMTSRGLTISEKLVKNYFHNLVNQFFKILPMRENKELSLNTYMESLQVELLGCKSFLPEMQDNHSFLTLMNILQYLIDNSECEVATVRREVFKAISVCGKIEEAYMKEGVSK